MSTEDPTAGAVIGAFLREKAEILHRLEDPARHDEPDAVHQMRIATRTLRSTLRTFGPLFEPADTLHWDTELRWLGSVLGTTRDAEVLEAQILELLAEAPGHLVRGPVRDRITTELAPVREGAHETLLAALDSPRYATLGTDLTAFTTTPAPTDLADQPASEALPDLVDGIRKKVRRRMRTALHLPPGADRADALHRARRRARQTRYAAEAVTPVFGDGARRLARRMKSLQDVLGAQRDRMVAGEAVERFGASAAAAGEDAFTWGLLRGYAERDALVFDGRVREGWERVGRGRRGGWSKR